MDWRWVSRLCWVAALTLASSQAPWEPGRQSEEGMNFCNVLNMEVYTGGNKSLALPFHASSSGELVKKYDPETKKWVEQILHARGTSNGLSEKTASISLFNANFTVWNAGTTEDGLYRVIDFLGSHCLAEINVTVQDLPFPEAAVPPPGISSRPTETTKASLPGKNGAVRCCSTSVLIFIVPFFILFANQVNLLLLSHWSFPHLSAARIPVMALEKKT
ncbi:uncharacterized protein LOC125429631 [Sphaerodactylus townsendi]|uniref:uncharacterized protein LOC125429631 n=1 Tax=Sphaerodactylus townsendi TaxID=933632 RepID=UPI002026CFFC|nr:uncharacterized protein LOC125429631 [Sphaerodactylus townsendi]